MTDLHSRWVDPNPPDPTNPRTPVILAVAGVVLTAVVVAALVAVVVLSSRDDSDGPSAGDAFLTAVNATVPDPFTDSVLVMPVAISNQVASDSAELLQQIPIRADRGVRMVSGLQARLYGATGQTYPCDVATLANYLTRDAATAAAWGLALGLKPEQIPYYLNTLTPVALLSDVWVTSYSLQDGAAKPRHAILQAATAVLIDPLGVPRVRCASGAPLTPPEENKLSLYRLHGNQWEGFSPQGVVAIKYASTDNVSAANEFTLVDVETGQDVVRKPGGTIHFGTATVPLPDPAMMNVPP